MSIRLYDDLHFLSAAERPRCVTQIDNGFGPTIAINLLWRGRIHFAVQGEPSTVLEGPVAFWTWHDTPFRYGNVTGYPWHHFWAHAGGERARRLVDGGLVPVASRPWSVPTDPEAFVTSFRRLVALVNSGRPDDQPERVQLFERLCLEAVRARDDHPAPSPSRRITALAERIAAEPTRNYDFAREAKHLGFSYHHLRRRFAEQIGRAPQAYLLDCRMRWAAARLTTGAESVKSVAYAAGFADPRAFARQFRRRTGVAPNTLLR